MAARAIRVFQLLGGATFGTVLLILASIGATDLGLSVAVLTIVGWATVRIVRS
jgi:hypothetical protein